MSEEEIMKYLESYIQFFSVLKAPEPQDAKMMKAVKGIIDLYNKEKLNTLNLSEQLNKEQEKNKKIEDKIKMETNRLKEHGYWEFLEQRDLDKTISIIQNFLEE